MTYRKYRSYVVLCASLFAAYVLLALATTFTKSGEFFPIFNGHWFVKTPHTVHDYGLMITSINNEKMTKPIYIDKNYALASGWTFAIYGAIQQIGAQIDSNAPDAATHLKQFENNYLKLNKYEFEIHKREYDILQFLKHGDVTHAKKIGP